MKETDYAYAVARIRANEAFLLSAADMEQLAAADGYPSALRVLEGKGWMDPEHPNDINLALKLQTEKAWQLLIDIAPDIGELEFLIVKNDFHNIKAALKSFVSTQIQGAETNAAGGFIIPFSIDPGQIHDAVSSKKYNDLPDYARDAIQKTYEVLIRTMDGQLADIMLDAMALETIMEKAGRTGNPFIKEIAELMCVAANIKTAFRAARTGKNALFLETALCRTRTLDKKELIEAAMDGPQALIDYISITPYSEASEFMKTSTAAFERWCDDILMKHVQKSKYLCLGIEPLVAYHIAKEAEVKSVRIILSCKHNGLPQETVKERMRALYV